MSRFLGRNSLRIKTFLSKETFQDELVSEIVWDGGPS